jgi:FAD/FMN-containing dehydrogenase
MPDLSKLRAAMRGTVLAPGDPGWDEARTPWNLAVTRSPALIALPTTEPDVQSVMAFAAESGLRVAPQCSGHNAGAAGSLDGAILLSMVAMTGVSIDPERQLCRAEAGVRWGMVTAAADKDGLFPVSGSAADVGVTGYTLGGGLSFLSRLHGLAASNVTRLRLVTPDAWGLQVSPAEHPDLFWAVRGGGASFGAVTELEFRLFPHGQVTAGVFLWPYDRRHEVLDAWVEWAAGAPDTISTSLRILHVPKLETVPPFLAGRSVVVIDGVDAGDPAAAAGALAGLRALGPELDTWAPCTPAGLDGLHMDPPDPTPGVSTSMVLRGLGPAARARLADAVPPGGPVLLAELRQLGGALASAPPGAGVTGSLPGAFTLYAVGFGSREASPEIQPALDVVRAAVAEEDTGRAFANLAEQPAPPEALYPAADLARLRELRAAVDPRGVLLSAHPLGP